MNYAMGQDIVEAYAQGELSGTAANNQMQDHFAAYPEASAAMSFNLIASHDTDRLLTMLGGGEMGGAADAETVARHRLAAAILYALPGMPMTFQGDECAFLGGRDGRHTARYPVQWDNCDPAMMQHYTELATLKRSTAALASPAFRQYPDAGGLLAFYRGEPGAGELIAVFNNGASQANLTLPAGSWTDVATGSSYSGTVPVEGLGWRYLEGS
jgi:glycosidase